MPTQTRGRQIKDDDVGREDINVTTVGRALATKVQAGTNIGISYTGADVGTGDVTVGLSGVVGVGNGGTGVDTLTGVVIGNGTSEFTGVAGTSNQVLRRNTANTAYEFYTLPASVLGTIAAGQVAFGTDANTIGGDADFTYNSTTNLLTLGGGLTLTGAQTIQTSTGNITLATAAGNGNILLSAHGTGFVDVIKNDRALGAELRITNAFNGSGWLAGDIIGTINFFSSDTSNPENIRSQIQSLTTDTVGTYATRVALVFKTADLSTLAERWRITSLGVLQSNGAQTIQTSTGNLTLATAAGNGNILLTPNGTGRVGINTASPTATLDIRVQGSGGSASNASNSIIISPATIADITEGEIGSQIILNAKRNGVSDGVSIASVMSTANFDLASMAFYTHSNTSATPRVESMRIFGGTGNLLIQNGGTFTDSGFRLDVNGTGRFSGELNVQYNNAITTMQGNTGFSVFRMYGGNGSSSNVVEFQIRNRVDGSDISSIGNFSNHDLQLRTNNVNRLTIAASTGAATFSSIVNATIFNSTGGRGTSFGFRLPDWQIYNTSSGNALAFNNYTTDLVTITSGGNVGIGTTAPIAPLQVTGQSASPNNGFFLTTNSFSSLSSGSLLRIGHVASSGNTTAIIQNLGTGGQSAANISFPDGNVGIGTTTVSELLDIRGVNRDETSGQFNQVIYSTSSQDIGRGGSIGLGGFYTGTSLSTTFGAIKGLKENGFGDNTAGVLGFYTRPNAGAMTERLRITSNGTLGFNGSGAVGNAGLDKMSMGYLNSNYGWIQTWNSTPLLLNPSGNNVGIGVTSPQSLLHIDGTLTFTEPGFDTVRLNQIASSHSDGSSPNNNLRFLVSDGSGVTAERIRINGLGNLLIGTTADNGNRLRVNGTIFSDSSVTATSFFESSDSRIKTLIEDDLDYKAIAGVTTKYYEKNSKKELGYFAQDFETLLPSAVSKNQDGYLNLSYREVHTAKIAYLEQKIKQLENELGKLSK